MDSVKKIAEALHDLILVNNDRAALYEKGAAQIKTIDFELTKLFEECAEESHDYAEELDEKITLIGNGDGIESTSLYGKIYRTWLDIKFIVSGADRHSLLSVCEKCEDATQQAYDEALKEAANFDAETISLLEFQKRLLRDSHDLIKDFRDRNQVI